MCYKNVCVTTVIPNFAYSLTLHLFANILPFHLNLLLVLYSLKVDGIFKCTTDTPKSYT